MLPTQETQADSDPQVEAYRRQRLRRSGRFKLVLGVLVCIAAAILWMHQPEQLKHENGRLKAWLPLVFTATVTGPSLLLAGVRNLLGKHGEV
jgi:hypothetical protein